MHGAGALSAGALSAGALSAGGIGAGTATPALAIVDFCFTNLIGLLFTTIILAKQFFDISLSTTSYIHV